MFFHHSIPYHKMFSLYFLFYSLPEAFIATRVLDSFESFYRRWMLLPYKWLHLMTFKTHDTCDALTQYYSSNGNSIEDIAIVYIQKKSNTFLFA